MPNVEVNCSISNCTFHAEGNICGADKITIDMGNQSKYDTEFSQEFDALQVARKQQMNLQTPAVKHSNLSPFNPKI